MVSDTAANLLANAAGSAKATSVTLSGTANTVTAAQATSLAALPGFALASGATLACPTPPPTCSPAATPPASPRPPPFAERHRQHRHRCPGNTLATLHGFGLGSGATLTVADTAASLLASGNAAGIAKATAVTLSGTANAVTAAQATSLAVLHGFTLGSAATLSVTDTAANLLANAAGHAKATSVTLSGTTNTVTAAQATMLAGSSRLRSGLRRDPGGRGRCR